MTLDTRVSGSGGIDERASVPGYGTTSHLPRYQEKQQTVTAAWAGWRPLLPSMQRPADRSLTEMIMAVVAPWLLGCPGTARQQPVRTGTKSGEAASCLRRWHRKRAGRAH